MDGKGDIYTRNLRLSTLRLETDFWASAHSAAAQRASEMRVLTEWAFLCLFAGDCLILGLLSKRGHPKSKDRE
jgi:hypothetical protein